MTVHDERVELERGRKARLSWKEGGCFPRPQPSPDGLVRKRASESQPTTAETIFVAAQA